MDIKENRVDVSELIKKMASGQVSNGMSDVTSLVLSLYTETEMYQTDYYFKFMDACRKGKTAYGKSASEMKEYLSGKLKDILTSEIVDYGTEARISFLKLLLYPIFNGKIHDLSKHSDFNINIEFFSNIKKENVSNYNTYLFDDMMSLKSFKFDSRSKLSSFTLEKIGTGMSYEYNSKYKLSAIIFCDGERMKVPSTFKSKSSGPNTIIEVKKSRSKKG